ncbi:hypothetical protein MRB53_030393 [Persea americana]|uniref:Uncharacterized protein n=1 Tax=Persea americana TaxID=3435 RepID=A0ACC2KL42_PERAE|nr:hypothetical protein MRB53_030393 [Persea americana]
MQKATKRRTKRKRKCFRLDTVSDLSLVDPSINSKVAAKGKLRKEEEKVIGNDKKFAINVENLATAEASDMDAVEMFNNDMMAEESLRTVEDVNVEGPPETTEPLILEAIGTSDNVVLQKLLRGPRSFDPPDNHCATCYNCGKEVHFTANCTEEKRKKPCFVCGEFGLDAKYCTMGQDCYICKRRGHIAKSCPETHHEDFQNSKICLRCSNLRHDMRSNATFAKGLAIFVVLTYKIMVLEKFLVTTVVNQAILAKDVQKRIATQVVRHHLLIVTNVEKDILHGVAINLGSSVGGFVNHQRLPSDFLWLVNAWALDLYLLIVVKFIRKRHQWVKENSRQFGNLSGKVVRSLMTREMCLIRKVKRKDGRPSHAPERGKQLLCVYPTLNLLSGNTLKVVHMFHRRRLSTDFQLPGLEITRAILGECTSSTSLLVLGLLS